MRPWNSTVFVKFLWIVVPPTYSLACPVEFRWKWRKIAGDLTLFYTGFFLLSYCTGGVTLTPLKIELISFLKTTSYIFSCLLASNDQFSINFMTSLFLIFFLSLKNFKKFKERYHQKKFFFQEFTSFSFLDRFWSDFHDCSLNLLL